MHFHGKKSENALFCHSREACLREGGERESRKNKHSWTPASAGVTTSYEAIIFEAWKIIIRQA
jgi:hypothetical protein